MFDIWDFSVIFVFVYITLSKKKIINWLHDLRLMELITAYLGLKLSAYSMYLLQRTMTISALQRRPFDVWLRFDFITDIK